MPPVTSDTLNARREKDCFAITNERKYYHLAADRAFVKRSLRPTEWQYGPPGGLRSLFIPARGDDRILNEAAALRFLADTSVPVPKLYACFQDDEAAYLVTEYVDGVAMASLDEEKRKPVEKDVEVHLATLRSLTSDTWGGVTGLVIPPYRVMKHSPVCTWDGMKRREEKDLVFCHNDLSAHNIIVDPTTLKINAIVDWEYAGFYPREFEGLFYKRIGPSVALEGEEDDEARLYGVMCDNWAGLTPTYGIVHSPPA